jgi:hypothetical protein
MKLLIIYFSVIFLIGIPCVSKSQINTETYHQENLLKDKLFQEPYIDIDEWRDTPVKHHYVHGGFKGTDTRFSFYFPIKEQYKGHFFQYITPVPDNEFLSQNGKGEEDRIGFSIESGAYFIETNGGGAAASGMPGSGVDPTIAAYRANAASAQYSKIVANKFYGPHRVYGYAFGGSGGAFRTIGGIENTENVWDGAVPYVVGSPMAIPNVFSVRMHAMRVLKNKFAQINDALEPGGKGNMYAGLNDEEQEALKEATKMGFPPKSWFGYQTMGIHAFPVLYNGMAMADPKYFQDFWKVPGYLGANAPQSLLKARIQINTKIKAAINVDQAKLLGLVLEEQAGQASGTADAAWRSLVGNETSLPVAFRLMDTINTTDFLGGDLLIKSGKSAGKKLFIKQIAKDIILLGGPDLKTLAGMMSGDEVTIDNSNFLAAQTYYRHQVPSKDFTVWNQFIGSDGKPIYPQRPMLLGPLFSKAASGTLQTGKFKGKMILLESLWDREAFPWQADWYRRKVQEYFKDSTDDHFVIWYMDHALHGDSEKQEDPTHTISYLGALQQALRDLSDWVEKGIRPPSSTNYLVVDGQVMVPEDADARKGIQPIVKLKINGKDRIDVKKNTVVNFSAQIELPTNAGKIISADWDFEGKATFSENGKISSVNQSVTIAKLQATHLYSKAGTYFVTLKTVAQREGNTKTAFTRINNLSRVRVVVN